MGLWGCLVVVGAMVMGKQRQVSVITRQPKRWWLQRRDTLVGVIGCSSHFKQDWFAYIATYATPGFRGIHRVTEG